MSAHRCKAHRPGDVVCVTREPGRNEIVPAVTVFAGGWPFWARLAP